MSNFILTDKYNRNIDYLRISVTDKCNLKCIYCSCGVTENSVKLLRDEEILEIAKVASKLGFKKVRLTGGEPLLRKSISRIISELRHKYMFQTVAITTNGTLLSHALCDELCDAGITSMTISLDSLNREKYQMITGADKLQIVLDAIEYTAKKKISNVKVNTVVFESTTAEEIGRIKEYCRKHNVEMQTIGKFSLTDREKHDNTIIPTDRPLSCTKCNRIRLSCDGYIVPCLFSDLQYKIDYTNIEGTICKAIENKPESGSACSRQTLQSIGG